MLKENFTIRCNDIKEFNSVQLYLFSKGCKWISNSNEIIKIDYALFPIVIKNHSIFTNMRKDRLIYDGYFSILEDTISTKQLLTSFRKEKLKKLNKCN